MEPVKKMSAIAGTLTLELSVSKTGGPVATAAEVASTGSDDRSFSDAELTPGPATMPLSTSNTYVIVWTGAFVQDGSVTLEVIVRDATSVTHTDSLKVDGKADDVFFRVVLLP